MTENANPVKFMIDNQDVILEAHNANNRSPKATWKYLWRSLPQLGESMTFNTFKQYITPFALIVDAVTQEMSSVKPINKGTPKRKLHKNSVNIDGWTVHKGKDGYFRLHRRINGKLHSIYGGKTLNSECIREKIKAKEKESDQQKKSTGSKALI